MRGRTAFLVVGGMAVAVAALALCGGLGSHGGSSEAGLGKRAESAVEDVLGDDGMRGLVGDALSSAETQSWESELPLEGEAAHVLETYQEQGDCVVAQAGYLDLAGRIWGCVMQGEGWVEVCLVNEGADGTSDVFVWHMDADDVDVAP